MNGKARGANAIPSLIIEGGPMKSRSGCRPSVSNRSRRGAARWLAGLLVPGAAAALAQEPLVNELTAAARLQELMNTEVSTVSRVLETVDQTPGSVYVFTREMIWMRGYRSLAELLQTVPGFTVFHRDLQFVAGVRGLNANDNEKITLLVNGQNLNNVNEPDFLNGPINLDNVERVEVVVGPSSLFQQANTLAATVNVITRHVQGAEVRVAAGNDLKYSTTAMLGHEWDPARRVDFSFTTMEQKGFDAWDAFNRPALAGRKETGALDQPNYFSVLNGQWEELSGQIVAYRTSMPELNINNGGLENDGRYVDQFYSVALKQEHAWTPTLTSVVKVDATLKEQTRLNHGGTPVNAAEVANKQRVYSGELGLRYEGFDRHVIQTGVQGSYDDNYESFYSFNVTAPPEHYARTTLVDGDSHALGFYADDEFRLTDRIKLVGGLRADRNTRLEGDRWFPGGRAAVIASLRTNWISKVMYNRAVRMPAPWATSLNQAWGKDKQEVPSFAAFSSNADEPEQLSTLEWQNIFYLGRARLGTTLYRQELEDFISWFEPHSNAGDFSGHGVEVDLQVPVGDQVNAWANASWNDSKLRVFARPEFTLNEIEQHVVINEDRRIIGAPEYTANAGFDYAFARDLVFAPALRYFTGQASFDNEAGTFSTIQNRCYLDAALTWKNAFCPHADLQLAGVNILDNRDDVGGQWLKDTYRPRGATFTLALAARF